MSTAPKYKRVLLKLSGESLRSRNTETIDAPGVEAVVEELLPVWQMDVQIGLVVGGGNVIRGRDLQSQDTPPQIRRATADHMGMLATVINALALHDALEAHGVSARTLSAISMTGVCEPFDARRAVHHLENGRVGLFAGGTGSPFFSTDTCAALRASEIGAEVLLKATKVGGVFDSDPEKNDSAKRYDRLTYQKVLADRLGVMDLTAIAMCMESRIPIIVFELAKPGNLAAVVRGEKIGTLISE